MCNDCKTIEKCTYIQKMNEKQTVSIDYDGKKENNAKTDIKSLIAD